MTTLISSVDSAIQIRPALPQDSEVVLDILHRATDKLLAKGIKQWTNHCEAESIREAIMTGEQFVAAEAGQLSAVFKLSSKSSNLVVEAARPGNLYLSQLAVDPASQNKGVGKMVMARVLQYADGLGKTLYLDCWAGNTKLKQFYKDCGLELLGDFPEEDYFISVFRSPPAERSS